MRNRVVNKHKPHDWLVHTCQTLNANEVSLDSICKWKLYHACHLFETWLTVFVPNKWEWFVGWTHTKTFTKPPERLPFTSRNWIPCFHRMFKEGQKLRTINSERWWWNDGVTLTNMPYVHLACSINFFLDFSPYTQYSDNVFGHQLMDGLISL